MSEALRITFCCATILMMPMRVEIYLIEPSIHATKTNQSNAGTTIIAKTVETNLNYTTY